MRCLSFSLLFTLTLAAAAAADEAKRLFADQDQYELFYDYKYQSNIIESFLFECTGEDNVSWDFAMASAGISNNYESEILGISTFSNPFNDDGLMSRLAQETMLIFTRDPEQEVKSSDPVLLAQRDILRLMTDYADEKDVLCDFVFWQEVARFESLTDDLIQDARDRKSGTSELEAFLSDIEEDMRLFDRLFGANPLLETDAK